VGVLFNPPEFKLSYFRLARWQKIMDDILHLDIAKERKEKK
jgi:hypothetical protein